MPYTFSPAVLATIARPVITDPVRAQEVMATLRLAAAGRSRNAVCLTVTKRADYRDFVSDWDALVARDA